MRLNVLYLREAGAEPETETRDLAVPVLSTILYALLFVLHILILFARARIRCVLKADGFLY